MKLQAKEFEIVDFRKHKYFFGMEVPHQKVKFSFPNKKYILVLRKVTGILVKVCQQQNCKLEEASNDELKVTDFFFLKDI